MQSILKKSILLDFLRDFLIFSPFIFSVIFIPGTLFAQDETNEKFILSPRVGEDLDSNEIEYFNLFPDINAVKSAVYRLDNFENLKMLLSLANGKDTVVSFSKLGALELRTYINKHEVLADSQSIVNWELLPGYGISKMNFFEDHGSILYVFCDSIKYSGKLLKIDEQNLILWTSTQPFKPDTWNKYSKKIPANSITKIERKQDLTGKIFGISIGAGLGAAILNIGFAAFNSQNLSFENSLILVAGGGLVGGAFGWLYDGLTISRRKYNIQKNLSKYLNVKPKLEVRAIFHEIFPPELKNL